MRLFLRNDFAVAQKDSLYLVFLIFLPYVIVNESLSELPFVLASKPDADIFSETLNSMSVLFSDFFKG